MNRKALFVIMVLALSGMTGCAYFGETTDRNDWYGVMSPQTYAEHHENLLNLDERTATVDTNILVEKKLQVAINAGNTDKIKKWLKVRNNVQGENLESEGGYNAKKGLVFSRHRRYILKLYKTSNRKSAFRTFAFDRNQKQYASLPYGTYIPKWVISSNRTQTGAKFEVKPGKVVYYDGNKLGWYAGYH